MHEQVVIILDYRNGHQFKVWCEKLLWNKFQSFQKSYVKLVANREALQNSYYVPIEFMHDKEFVMKHVQQNPYSIKYLPEKMKTNMDILKAAFKTDWAYVSDYFSMERRFNEEFLLELISINPKVLRSMTGLYPKLLGRNGMLLAQLDSSVINADLGYLAVKQNGAAFKYVPTEEKREVLRRIRINGDMISNGEFLKLYEMCQEKSDQLSKEMILSMIEYYPEVCEFIPPQFLDDIEIARTAVQKNGQLLRYFSYRIRTNREIVLKAVKNDAEALQYSDMCTDREIALQSVRSCGTCLAYCAPSLKNDEEIVSEALKNNGNAWIYASPSLRTNVNLLIQAVENSSSHIYLQNESHQTNRDLMLILIKLRSQMLKNASLDLRNDRELVLEAIRGNPSTIQYASQELLDDEEFLLKALVIGGPQILSDYVERTREFVLKAVKINGCALSHCPSFSQDPEIVMEAIKQNGFANAFSQDLFTKRLEWSYEGLVGWKKL